MSAPETPNPEDPLRWIIENHFSKKSQSTEDNARIALLGKVGQNGKGAEVALKPWLKQNDISPREFSSNNAYEYINDIKKPYRPSSYRAKIQIASRAYNLLMKRNVEGINYNPIGKIIEDYPNLLEDSTKRNSTIYGKGEVKQIIEAQHPVEMVISMLMLKTTRRIGGVVNLDRRDIHIDHPAANWTVHQEIRDKPDHIHFGPGVSQGEIFRGETRRNGMKTKTRVPIPMDQELKSFLIWYLPFRRLSGEGAFFTNPSMIPEQRVLATTYGSNLTSIAREQGLYYGAYDPDNVRPHYWRHWTTTKMRDRIDDGIVDYFRGDKKEVSDIYNHYTEKKARLWTENIPKFYKPYKKD